MELQKKPWQQDFNAIMTGGNAKIFKFQAENEAILAELYAILKNAKVVSEKATDGRERDVVKINFPQSAEDKKAAPAAGSNPMYEEMKRSDDFEKKITEMNKNFEKSIDVITERITKKSGQASAASKEAPKPIRVITFTKNKMLQLSQDLLATISTIRFAAYQAAKYSQKNMSDEDSNRLASKADREKARVKCQDSKRMGTSGKGDGC